MAIESLFSKKFIHVGIVVKDMDEAIKHLKSLGIGPVEPFDPKSLPQLTEQPLYKGKPFKPDCKSYVAKAGDIELELFQPIKGESPWMDFLNNNGEGVQHIAFMVDDLENEIARLTETGANILLRIKWKGGGGCCYLDLGISNIAIELLQY